MKHEFRMPCNNEDDEVHSSHGSEAVRITVPLASVPADPPWPPYDHEILAAVRVNEQTYRLENIPFYAKGLSRCDVVSVRQVVPGAPLIFHSVVARGGHSTYRISVYDGLSSQKQLEYAELIAALSDLHCEFETAQPGFLSIDVPESVNVQAVYAILELGDEVGVWDFDEGHYEPPRKYALTEALADRERRTEGQGWWWLSFVDPKQPNECRFLGVAIVEGSGVGSASLRARSLGINPGGEVQGSRIADNCVPRLELRNRLLSKAELEQADLI